MFYFALYLIVTMKNLIPFVLFYHKEYGFLIFMRLFLENEKSHKKDSISYLIFKKNMLKSKKILLTDVGCVC